MTQLVLRYSVFTLAVMVLALCASSPASAQAGNWGTIDIGSSGSSQGEVKKRGDDPKEPARKKVTPQGKNNGQGAVYVPDPKVELKGNSPTD